MNNLRGDTPLGRGNFVGGITLTGTNAQMGYLNRQALMVSSGGTGRYGTSDCWARRIR